MPGIPQDNDQAANGQPEEEEIIELTDDDDITLEDFVRGNQEKKAEEKTNDPMKPDAGEAVKDVPAVENTEPEVAADALEIEEIEIEKPASEAAKKKTEAEEEMEEAEMQTPQHVAAPGTAKSDTKEALQDESGLLYRPKMYRLGYFLGKFLLGPSAKLGIGTAKLAGRGAKAAGQGALWLGKKTAQGAGTLAVGAYRSVVKYPEGSEIKRVVDEQKEREKARKIEEKSRTKEEKELEKSEKAKAKDLAKKYPGSIVDPKSIEGKILALREEEAKKAQKEARKLEEQARPVRERAEREKARAMDKATHEQNRGTLRKAFDYVTFRQGSKRAGENADRWQKNADALSEKAQNAETKAQGLKTGIATAKVEMRQSLMERLMTPEMAMDPVPEPVMRDPADQQTLTQSMEAPVNQQTLGQTKEPVNQQPLEQAKQVPVNQQTADPLASQPTEKSAQETAKNDSPVKMEPPVHSQDAPAKTDDPVKIEISYTQLRIESGELKAPPKPPKIKVSMEPSKEKKMQVPVIG